MSEIIIVGECEAEAGILRGVKRRYTAFRGVSGEK